MTNRLAQIKTIEEQRLIVLNCSDDQLSVGLSRKKKSNVKRK